MSSDDVDRDADALVKQAKACLGQRQFDRADEIATSAIKLDPRNAPAYLVRAETRRKLGRPDQALADLAVSIRLDPSRAPAYVVRAEILKKRCLFDQAIADATHALFLNPENAAAFAIRTECRRAIGDLEGAAEDAQELARIDPTRPIGPQASGAGQARGGGSSPEDRFYKGAGADRPDLRGDLFEDGQPADRSMKSKIIDDPDEAADALARASGYKPGVIVRPMPRAGSQRRRPSRQAPWVFILLGGAALFTGGLLWARKDQPKESMPEKNLAVEDAGDSGPLNRPEPVAAPAVSEVMPSREYGNPAGRFEGDHRSLVNEPERAETIAYRDLHWVSVRSGNPARGRPVFRDEDGILVGDGSQASYLRTDEVFEDFVLRLDYKFSLTGTISGPGSGLLLLPPDREGNPAAGIECQVKPGETGDIYAFPGSTATGVLSPSPNIDRDRIKHVGSPEFPRGDWNSLEVRCEGRSITVALNGQVTSRGESDRPIRCRVALMSQGTVVNYRNISITQSSPSPVLKAPDDPGDIQGEWVMVREELDGEPDPVTQERRITIRGQDFVMGRTRNGQYGEYRGKVLIDRAARSFDFEGTGPRGAHQEFKGIYEVDGDTLRMCYVYSFGNGARRPMGLRSSRVPGTTTISLVLRRARAR